VDLRADSQADHTAIFRLVTMTPDRQLPCQWRPGTQQLPTTGLAGSAPRLMTTLPQYRTESHSSSAYPCYPVSNRIQSLCYSFSFTSNHLPHRSLTIGGTLFILPPAQPLPQGRVM